MTTPQRVTAIYSIDDDGRTWLAHLAEEERVHTFGRNFTKTRAAIREAAALWFNVDEDGIEVLDQLPPTYQEPLNELRTARAQLAEDQAKVVAKTQDAVLMLRNWTGLPEREIAALTGISHQRVHQILTEVS